MSIKVDNISHTYSIGQPHQSEALVDVSFTIDDGELVGIIGHTGSGKSTLVQHLNGLLKPREGRIVVNGVDITQKGVSMAQVRKKIGLVFQYPEYQLFEETVERDVAFGPKNLELDKEEIDIAVKRAIELVGLDFEEIRNKSPFELSGGQKRRVAIAGVIAMNPEVLILDEPTAGLDPKAHQDILEMVKTIRKERKAIVILVSHNMDDIANMSDKVLVMDKGRLVLSGTPEQVFARGEALANMGLDLPETTRLSKALHEKGIAIAEELFHIDDIENSLYQILSQNK